MRAGYRPGPAAGKVPTRPPLQLQPGGAAACVAGWPLGQLVLPLAGELAGVQVGRPARWILASWILAPGILARPSSSSATGRLNVTDRTHYADCVASGSRAPDPAAGELTDRDTHGAPAPPAVGRDTLQSAGTPGNGR